MRAALTMSELSAITFGRSARSSTRCTHSDWRSGTSNALTMPSHSASTMRCQTATWPDHVSPASMAACRSASVCVTRERVAAPHVVGDDAGERAQEQDAGVAAERDDAEQPHRAGNAIGEPAHRNLLQPRSHHRESLPDEEQAEVAVPQRPKRLGKREAHDAMAVRNPGRNRDAGSVPDGVSRRAGRAAPGAGRASTGGRPRRVRSCSTT